MNRKLRKQIRQWISLTGTKEPLLDLLLRGRRGEWLETVLFSYLEEQDYKIPDIWRYFWFNHYVNLTLAEHVFFYQGVELGPDLERRYERILGLLRTIINARSYKAPEIAEPLMPFLGERELFYQELIRSGTCQLQDAARTYFSKAGSGPFSRYYYFEFQEKLEGVKAPKTFKLQELAGYEDQKGMLLSNTRRFLEGKPANNVFLYGSRGSGKTSLIKGLLEEYKEEGLRLIRVSRDDIEALPRLCEILKKRREKFIINLDDISYDEQELVYKKHKIALDAFFDREPTNVLLYATSNSQEIVKYHRQETTDNWVLDNRSGEERKLEMPQRQVYDERRAFTERFGLTVYFGRMDQEQMTKIMDFYRRQYDLKEELAVLLERYKAWVGFHGSPNGRTIENFIRQQRKE